MYFSVGLLRKINSVLSFVFTLTSEFLTYVENYMLQVVGSLIFWNCDGAVLMLPTSSATMYLGLYTVSDSRLRD